MLTVPVPNPQETYFTKINNRQVAKGPYRTDALLEHLKKHLLDPPNKRWCSLSCATKLFARVTDNNKRAMRTRFYKLSNDSLQRGILILKKYVGKYGQLQEIKIFDVTSQEDRDWAIKQYEIAREKGDETEERLQKIVSIINDESHVTLKLEGLNYDSN